MQEIVKCQFISFLVCIGAILAGYLFGTLLNIKECGMALVVFAKWVATLECILHNHLWIGKYGRSSKKIKHERIRKVITE